MQTSHRQRDGVWRELVLAVMILTGTLAPGWAEKSESATNGTADPLPTVLPTAPSITAHQIMLNGKPLKYTVTADRLPVFDEQGRENARIFYLAYTCAADTNAPQRPITFLFNGGPGAPSQIVNLLAFGPRYIPANSAGRTKPPPYELVDNPDTLLAVSDLVFIDPVGTGFSAATPPAKNDSFWTVNADIQSMSEFVRVFLARNNRRHAPVFIGGESYGGTRAGGMASKLQSLNIWPAGIILITPGLDMGAIVDGPGNFAAPVAALPSMAATAWAQQKAGPRLLKMKLTEVVDEARAWAATDFLRALWQGNELNATDRERVAGRLAEYTGLPVGYIRDRNLRVMPGEQVGKLLEGQGLTVSRFDGRVTGATDGDPLWVAFSPALSTLFDTQLRDEFGYVTDRFYSTVCWDVNNQWKYRHDGGSDMGYTYSGNDLASALRNNPHMKVFAAGAVFDLAVPHDAVSFALRQMDLPTNRLADITFKSYQSGHMPYLDEQERPHFMSDIRAFYETVLKSWKTPPTR